MGATLPPGPERFDRRRQEFPSLRAGIHLLSHSLGPLPRAARDSMQEYLSRWQQHLGEDAWAASWWELSTEVGRRFARILNAPAGSVQVQPNVSVALAVVASCFDFTGAGRSRVVTSALDFPTTSYIWEGQRRRGADIVVIPSEDGIRVPEERILAAIDERTALVSLSHTSFLSSFRIDPAPIIEKAHRAGARVVLDVYQSAGVVELDPSAWEVDFMVGGSIKWTCGGPATGYLYVRPDLIGQLEPLVTGWIAHADPFAFQFGPIRYDDSVRRFAQGTPNIPGLYSCLPGLALIQELGVERIAADSRRRTAWMVETAREKGWRLNSPVETGRRGGSVMIGVDDPPAQVKRLAERRVFVDCRPATGLRMSPHFFTTDDEVREAMEILAEIIG
ncbi:MAG: aminotransferase class V-fold PLP-dependent enzyme [Acidobacteriota bacterium]